MSNVRFRLSVLVSTSLLLGTYLVLWVTSLLLHDKGKNIPAWFVRLFGLPFIYTNGNFIRNTFLFRSNSMALADLERIEYAYHAVVGFVAVWAFTFKNGEELVVSPNRPGMNRLLRDLERILPGFSMEKWKQEFAQGDVEDTLVLWEAKPNPSIERTSQGLRPCAASHVKR